MIIIISILFYK